MAPVGRHRRAPGRSLLPARPAHHKFKIWQEIPLD